MKNHQIFSSRGPVAGLICLLLLATITWAQPSGAQEHPLPPNLDQKDITLETATHLAQQFNPGLQGFTAAEQQMQALVQQAKRGPNPELELGMENFAGSGSHHGFSAAEYTLSLSQTFEFGEKRLKESEAAGWQVKDVGQEALMVGLQVESRVVTAFIATLKSQEEITLALKLVDLAQANLDFVKRRVAMGAVSSIEQNQALVDVHSARLELETARQAWQIAKIRLASLWNSPVPTFARAGGSLESMCELPTWEELTRRLPSSPALKQWDIEAGKRRAAVDLAKAMGSLDLSASAGFRHYQDNGDFAAVAAVSIPLQFRNKNVDAQRAAQYRLDQLETDRQTQVLNLRAALLDQYQSVTTTHGHIVSIRDEILPSAEKAMQQSEEAYRKGRFTMTDLLAVRRTWFQWRQNYVTALADYQTAIAQIHRILGDNHPEILNSRENH